MKTGDLVLIRPAREQDAALVTDFIRQLARYEKLEHHCIATEAQVRATLFDGNPCADVLLAFENDVPAGFAIYFFTYSTFLAKRGFYLEDLFVVPELRGRGIGKKLFAELMKIARDRDCGRFEWSVLDWNEPALRFYEKLGAIAQREWVRYRLDTKQISRLAEQDEFS